MTEPILRTAQAEDVPAIEKLLIAESLPAMQIEEFLPSFWVLDDGGTVVGAAGLEVYGDAAVLRSVVVAPSLRGTRQGERLADAALAEARCQDVRYVYLFTKDAGPFFARFGFKQCSLDDFQLSAREAWQYKAMREHPQLAAYLKPMRLELS